MNGARGEVWLYERPQRKPRPPADPGAKRGGREAEPDPGRALDDCGSPEHPHHVWIDEDDGMREPCALVLDETFAARKDFLTHRITTLGAEKMDEVCRALGAASGY